ncbi:hypothetical protein BDV37DRAFT_267081 [Aspergillus pseudonomiae]|uniref:Uncharacterized protein n=1 Tax=Aspergillus pseudonomiae TaxID=1506151 RepID=A0A5N7CS10_9EURO|nr:uncharacterized protein BDV37DRAFT_267081 [Aspergillus pseudonomiae]KAE8396925.1 hypothetical protein BDV37DRAFT_267081 [Aspergillus pseudonomiae]
MKEFEKGCWTCSFSSLVPLFLSLLLILFCPPPFLPLPFALFLRPQIKSLIIRRAVASHPFGKSYQTRVASIWGSSDKHAKKEPQKRQEYSSLEYNRFQNRWSSKFE